MLVSGVVQIRRDGTARLDLAAVDRQSAQPAQTGQGAQVSEVPTVQSVFDMIQGGDLELHATRGSITKSERCVLHLRIFHPLPRTQHPWAMAADW